MLNLHFIMYLKNIHLVQFRNHPKASFHFNQKIIGICGKNGAGKSNLLDAIYMLCLIKSYFNRTDSNSVHFLSDGYLIEGIFNLEFASCDTTLKLKYKMNEKKQLNFNEERYTKMGDHIGKYPCVFSSPEKLSIITEGNTERRRYMDVLFSQLSPKYLQHCLEYNKVLLQRNAYLKNALVSQHYDTQLLHIYAQQLCHHAQNIFESRTKYFCIFEQIVLDMYHKIASQKDNLSLKYSSSLSQPNYFELFTQNIELDKRTAKTNMGVHKDELDFLIDNVSIKHYGSQGQKKTLLLALTIAECRLINTYLNKKPILIMDDLLEHLDQDRILKFITILKDEPLPQIFISSPLKDNLMQTLSFLDNTYQIIEIKPS